MIRAHISRAYTRPSDKSAFSGINNIQRRFRRAKLKDINETLASVNSYTLHRETKKVKHHNPFFIYLKRQQIQMDLIDISKLAKFNFGVKFLLVAIDGFTKKAWVETMINKSARISVQAIQNVLQKMIIPAKSIFFDRGREFVNEAVYEHLRQVNIKVLHPNSEIKAAIAERFNRSLQDLIYKYLTENETRKYINVLDSLVKTYNQRGHRTLKFMSPNEAEQEENKNFVISALNEYYSKFTSLNIREKYKIGDYVRLYKYPNKFTRGYQERFTRELFEIIAIKRRMPIPTYQVKSCNTDDIIKGTFYNRELQKVTGNVFKIEKVLRRRTTNGQLQLYVKWLDFGDHHNSWISGGNVKRVFNNDNT